jgi:hypothetical protein
MREDERTDAITAGWPEFEKKAEHPSRREEAEERGARELE